MFYQIIAIIILVIFYGIFFAKQFLQKKKGKKSDNAFSISDISNLSNINTESAFGIILTAAVTLVGIAEAASALLAGNLRMLPAPVRILGMLLAIFGTGIFALSSYSLHNTDGELVKSGVYGWSRNPAFFGFDMLFAGMLLMFYSVPLLLLSIFAAVMFHIQIMVEERHLTKTYGNKYIEYKKAVRRYFGKRKAD